MPTSSTFSEGTLMTMKRFATNLLAIFCVFLFVESAPQAKMGYTGRLVKSNGVPITGTSNLKFELYYSNSTGTLLATQTINSVPLANGVYTVELDFDGSGSFPGPHANLKAIMDNVPSGHSLVIRVVDLTNSLTFDFQNVLAVPSAFQAEYATIADGVTAGSLKPSALDINGTCTDGQVIIKNGAQFECQTGGGGGGSGEANTLSNAGGEGLVKTKIGVNIPIKGITGTGDITVTGNANDIQIGINTSNTAGQLLRLDGSGALPAIDGSNLTGVATNNAASLCAPGEYLDGDGSCYTVPSSGTTYTAGSGIDITGGTISVDNEGLLDTNFNGISAFCANGEVLVTNGLGSFSCTDPATFSSGDDLGDHVVDQVLNLNGNWISGDADSEGIFITTAGNVGVGTNTPDAQIDVEGANSPLGHFNYTGSGAVTFVDFLYGGTSRGTISGGGSNNLSLSSTNHLDLNTAGGGIRIRGNGNVVVGSYVPRGKLDVEGEIFARKLSLASDNTTTSATWNIDNNTDGSRFRVVTQPNSAGAATERLGIDTSGNVTIPTLAGGSTRCVQVDSSGVLSATGAACGTGSGGEANTASNVGSGQGLFKQKTAPDLEFKSLTATSDITLTGNTDDVQIAINTSNGANELLRLDGSAALPALDGSNLTGIDPYGAGTGITKSGTTFSANMSEISEGIADLCNIGELFLVDGSGNFSCATVASVGDNMGNHIATSNIQLGTRFLSSDGGNEGIRVDASGNVFAGSGTPTFTGFVSGTGSSYLNLSGNNGSAEMVINSVGNSTGHHSALSFAKGANRIAYIQTQKSTTSANDADLIFGTSDATTLSEKMRITKDGDLGVGTSTPNEILTVEGVVSLKEGSAPTATADYGKIYVNTADSKLYFMNDAGTSFDLTAVGSGADNLGNHTATQTINTNGQYISGDSDAEGIFITAAGNVGIGSNTPTDDLLILRATEDATVKVQSNAADSSAVVTTTNDTQTWYSGVSRRLVHTTPVYNTGFGIGQDLTGGIPQLFLDPSGKVGFGTAKPIGGLELVHGARADTDTALDNLDEYAISFGCGRQQNECKSVNRTSGFSNNQDPLDGRWRILNYHSQGHRFFSPSGSSTPTFVIDNAVYSYNTNAAVLARGYTSAAGQYAFVAKNSSDTSLLSVENDGNVGVLGTLTVGSGKDICIDGGNCLSSVNDGAVTSINGLSDGVSDSTGFNLFLGHNGGSFGSNDIRNTGVGLGALDGLTNDATAGFIGDENVAVGFYSMTANSAGAGNTAVGAYSLNANTTGSYNLAVGRRALFLNTTGSGNVAFGERALAGNDSGTYNTALGNQSLSANTSSNNTAVGFQSLTSNTSGSHNLSVGVASAADTTTGSSNVAIGNYALRRNVAGNNNIAIGRDAAQGATGSSFSGNVAIGRQAGLAFETGADFNILIGELTGNTITTGASNILIGRNIQPSSATASSELNIGGAITGDLVSGNVSLKSEGRFLADNGTNYVALKAPDASTSSITYTLPDTDGTSGQVLQTNGSGVLSWATGGSGGGETNTASNVGTGAGVFKDKTTAQLNFRSIASSDSSVAITQNTNDINLSVNAGSIANGTGVYFGYQPNNSACSDGQVLQWNGAQGWVCGNKTTDTNTTYTAGNGIDSSVLTGSSQIAVELTSGNSLRFNGVSGALESSWELNGSDLFYSGGKLGIGTSAPTAALQVDSTTNGFLPPRMTQAQRNGISSPNTGLVVYNTDTDTLNIYNGTAWVEVGLGSGNLVSGTGGGTPAATTAATTNSGYVNFPGTYTVSLPSAGTYIINSTTFYSHSSGCGDVLFRWTGSNLSFQSEPGKWQGCGNSGTQEWQTYTHVVYVSDATTLTPQYNWTNTSTAGSIQFGKSTYIKVGGGAGTVGGSDNLGNHTLTQALNLGTNYISGDGDAEGLRVDAGNGALMLSETGTATTQTTGFGKLYVKSADSKLYFMNDTGEEFSLLSTSTSGNTVTGTGWISADGDDEGLFVRTDGKVGVGTNSATESLEVVGTVKASSGKFWSADGSTGTTRNILLENYNNTADQSGVDIGVKLSDIEFQGISWVKDSTWTSASPAADKDASLSVGVLRDGTPETAMFLKSNGRLGVGTTSPTGTLHLAEASNPALRISEGGSSTDYTEFVDIDANNGVFRKVASSGQSILSMNTIVGDGTSNAKIRYFRDTNSTGAKLLEIYKGDGTATLDSLIGVGSNSYFNVGGGNVGIGTSSPGQKLTISDSSASVSASINGTSFAGGYSSMEVVDDNYPALILNNTTGAQRWDLSTNTSGILGIYDNTGGGTRVISIEGGAPASLHIASSGNIGVGTSNPDSKLNLKAPNPVLNIQNTSSTAGSGGVIRFGHDQISDQKPIGEIRGELTNGSASRAGELSFWTSTGGTLSEAMRINESGKVGIGTTAPNASLDVQRAADNIPLAIFDDNSAANNFSDVVVDAFRPGIVLRDATTSSADWRMGVDLGDIVFSVDTNDDQSKDASSHYNDLAPVLTLKDNGRVGVGIAVPSNALHVSGNLGVTGWVGAGCEGACSSDAFVINYDDGRIRTSADGTTNCTKTGNSATFSCSSDERLKNTIDDFKDGLGTVLKLKPKTYFWNSDEEKENLQYGFIAQEVQKVIPHAVTPYKTEKGDEYLSLDQGAFTPFIINSIHDLDKKIEENLEILKLMENGIVQENSRKIASIEETVETIVEENERLKAENEELKARLERIEAHLGL